MTTSPNHWWQRDKEPNRPLMLHGPVMRRLLILMSVSLVISCGGWAYTLENLSNKADRAFEKLDANRTYLKATNKSRAQSAADTCYLFRAVLAAATAQSRHDNPLASETDAQVQAKLNAFEKRLHLDNCVALGRRVTHVSVPVPAQGPPH